MAATRSISSPLLDSRSQYHDPAISTASLRQQLAEQTQRRSNHRRIRRVITTNALFDNAIQKNREGDFDTPRFNTETKAYYSSTPLKPCIKKKSKSATTTPPNEMEGKPGSDTTNRALRRVKTVDFEENGSRPLLSTPPSPAAISKKLVDVTTNRSDHSPHTSRPKKTVHIASSPYHPSTINTIAKKSTPANPAITRTDVHVIAIAPSWNAPRDKPNNAATTADPATPTMQIVESRNGCYEVIWDDVPSEQNIRSRRRSSSASHALEKVSPSTATAARGGLERVNTKLSDWSGTWNNPSSSFKPTIVVFPDDDADLGREGEGYVKYYCTVDVDDDGDEGGVGDEDMVVLPAPPNSQTTSRAASRLPSRDGSPPLVPVIRGTGSGSGSAEQDDTNTASEESPPQTSPSDRSSAPQLAETTLAVPHVDTPPHHLLVDSDHKQNVKVPPPIEARRLSNMDENDLKFRGHRDSVTIAHSRLLQHSSPVSPVSPELFARTHRDSAVMARKRMHARNYKHQGAIREGRNDDDGESEEVVDVDAVKEHAVQALKQGKPGSILCSKGELQEQEGAGAGGEKHIRIVE
ncbi:hypothetical protein N0V83_001768 [Neocucurbitaria cava]|uniref:Uncharacterized protein n=1 Tax=Neocucurbitaria cava TaxID=798079 RepID=A0A9W8YHT1_9PLEO|nr:hypothetical protein N0V83_001768 [Neocucurbitaria cava]